MKMTKRPADEIPEIHVNRDKDRYFTMLLLKLDESGSEPTHESCSKLSGMNCCSVPIHCSQNNPGKASHMHHALGDKMFLSGDSLSHNSDQQKHSKHNDTNVDKRLDYSLPRDACINKKTFAYQPANGCYSQHKKSVQMQDKRHTNKNTINKTMQELEEAQNLQLCLDFQRYLSQLVPAETLNSVEDAAHHGESSRQSGTDKPKKSDTQKSLSAGAFGTHIRTKNSFPNVKTKASNVIPSRSSSFHSVHSGRSKQVYFEYDTHCNVPDDAWSLHGESDTRTQRTSGKIDRIKSQADLEIMQKIKYMHQTLAHTGVLPTLGSATNLDQLRSDVSNADSKPTQRARNAGRYSDACSNARTGDFPGSQVASANDNDCPPSGSTAMPQFPMRRNPQTYKPRVPHHVVALATGSCLAQQRTSSKPSLHGLEMLVNSMNPVIKSGSHLTYLSTGDDQSNTKANSGILPLEGKKMKTRKAKHRIL